MFRPPFNSALTVSQGLLNFSTCLSPQRQISHNCSSISFYFSAENFYPLTYSSFIRRGGELLTFSRKRNIDRWIKRREWMVGVSECLLSHSSNVKLPIMCFSRAANMSIPPKYGSLGPGSARQIFIVKIQQKIHSCTNQQERGALCKL